MKKKPEEKRLSKTVSPDLSVNLAGIKMKNPVMVASGTFGYGTEYAPFVDLDKLGAIITKTITLKPKEGNPPPRTMETPSGLLNSIGLENVGLDHFIKEKLPALRKMTKTPVIVSIGGRCIEEYRQMARALDQEKGVSGMEMNISCPNIEKIPARMIAQDQGQVYRFVKSVRKMTRLPLIVKLSPNVTDITKIARSAVKGGADALSLINTLTGMAVDVEKRKPVFFRCIAGLSGPALRPLGVRMVWECSRSVEVPVIGIGGIVEAKDALEYILSGATAVAVGTGLFVNPLTPVEIVDGMEAYLQKHRIKRIAELTTGGLRWKVT